MIEVITSPYFIAGVFFIVAFTYSSVGLGGGSSYTALMTVYGFGALTIPILSLTFNVIVSSVGSYTFVRNQHARLRLILPFLVSSIPMAYLGGALKLPQEIFYWLLLISLTLVATRIYFWTETTVRLNIGARGRLLVAVLSGSILGLIAGITGIGGGIYVVPLIIILGLGTAKEAAACGAIFVWFNSISGLVSRLQHNSIDLSNHLSLITAVLIGGAFGSFLGSSRFSAATMEKILGVIIIVAIVFLARRLLIS
ncbi:TSUP family transporter [Thiogranum longum]